MNLDDISIGVDIEDIDRFKDRPSAFYSKIFTAKEQEYCNKKQMPEQHYAVRFCAKEAFIKALCGLGWKMTAFSLSEIEIYNNESGCPMINYEKVNGIAAKVSLSHDQTKAVASVIVFKS